MVFSPQPFSLFSPSVLCVFTPANSRHDTGLVCFPLQCFVCLHPLTADMTQDFPSSVTRLAELQKRDQEKVALQKAKNELEGFIFDTQDKLSQETYEACSTEEERASILQQMSEASDWLYEQPEEAKKEVALP